MSPMELSDRVNPDAALVRRGRFVSTAFLLEVGAEAWLVRIHEGRVAEVAAGPFVMPRWTFALRAEPEAWRRYLSPEPGPGFHDLFALIKQRVLRAEGDLHPFMANLLYFKAVLGALREPAR